MTICCQYQGHNERKYQPRPDVWTGLCSDPHGLFHCVTPYVYPQGKPVNTVYGFMITEATFYLKKKNEIIRLWALPRRSKNFKQEIIGKLFS